MTHKRLKSVVSICIAFLSIQVGLVFAEPEPLDSGFENYLQGLKTEAVNEGFNQDFIEQAFASISLRKRVIQADNNQPERKITLTEYLHTRVPDWKVEQAVEKATEHKELLDDIAKKFGVQKRFIVALWGNESNFGRIQGKVPVLSALSTLAYQGRRESLFRKQFFAALDILQQGHVQLENFNGSWAGAMGQSQFMPTSFLTYAIDYDGDGRKDIWQTPADVFASIANYLVQEGWRDDQTWGREVVFTSNQLSNLAGLGRRASKSLIEWQALGIRKVGNGDLPNLDLQANLLMPDGPKGRSYLVYNNFQTLMKWNRSSYFGISVAYLSERIKKGS